MNAQSKFRSSPSMHVHEKFKETDEFGVVSYEKRLAKPPSIFYANPPKEKAIINVYDTWGLGKCHQLKWLNPSSKKDSLCHRLSVIAPLHSTNVQL